jgi:hypothetical protein
LRRTGLNWLDRPRRNRANRRRRLAGDEARGQFGNRASPDRSDPNVEKGRTGTRPLYKGCSPERPLNEWPFNRFPWVWALLARFPLSALPVLPSPALAPKACYVYADINRLFVNLFQNLSTSLGARRCLFALALWDGVSPMPKRDLLIRVPVFGTPIQFGPALVSTSATAATLANHFIVSSRCLESWTDEQSAAVVVPHLPHRRSFAISPGNEFHRNAL